MPGDRLHLLRTGDPGAAHPGRDRARRGGRLRRADRDGQGVQPPRRPRVGGASSGCWCPARSSSTEPAGGGSAADDRPRCRSAEVAGSPWPALVADAGGGCARPGARAGAMPAPSSSTTASTPSSPMPSSRRSAARPGSRCSVRTNDGVVLADQILQEGGASPGGRLPHRELARAHGSPGARAVGQADYGRCSTRCPPSDSSPTGHWVGRGPAGEQPSSTTRRLVSPRDLPTSLLDLAQPQWKGKVAVAPTDSDFPPLVGAVDRDVRQGRGAAVARRAQAQRPDLPGRGGGGRPRSTAATWRRGSINQYYWYRLAARGWQEARCTARLYYFPDHDVGSVENVSGAAVLASSTHRHERRGVPPVPRQPGRPADHRRTATTSSTRPGPGIAPNPALPPLGTISPATISVVALGNDQLAAQLVQQAGLV